MGRPAEFHVITRRSVAIVVRVVMMVVMVMMVVIPAAGRHHIHARPVIAVVIAVAAPIAMVMVVVIPLRHLHIAVRRFWRRLFIQGLQDLGGVRNRLQQLGVGVGLQRIRWTRRRGG